MSGRRSAVYPTWRGVALVAAGGPVSVLLALLVAPAWWSAVLPWIALALLLVAADALAAPSVRALEPAVALPDRLEAGAPPGTLSLAFPAARRDLRVSLAVEAEPLLRVSPERLTTRAGEGANVSLEPLRRGRAAVRALHLRWTGPLGLAWRGSIVSLARTIDIVPHLSAVREEAMRLYSRNREGGTAIQPDLAASLEFHALREFRAGDDPRAVNWRQSARHRALLVRETRAERNRTIVLAIDTGRLMSEPLDGGLPRLDRAVNAALLTAFVGLKAGDRVGLFAFAARPRLRVAARAGLEAFAALQARAAELDYSAEETNFTLGLSTLAAMLTTRALVVVFTEFADTTGAALMIANLGPLLQRHLVLFVSFGDPELDGLARAAPAMPADVSRAVVAGGLKRERDLVLGQLRRLGVEVMDAPAAGAGPALLRRYLAIKREGRL